MATATVKTTGDSKKFKFYHFRNWLGMPLEVWLPLLARNRFAASRWGQVARMAVFATGNSVFRAVDYLLYARRVRKAPPPRPPLFVIGHWRTGTTLLHELLVQDPRFSYPTTYRAMGPHSFLLTERFMPIILNHAMPGKRPMDNMEMGFDKPQEDEFALCNMGLPSPYLKMAFPNHYPEPGLYLDVEEFDAADRRRWIEGMRWFIRRLAWRDPRRVVLKSPTHTARIGALAQAFPGAQFVHIVRDPREVFASTVHTWKQLWDSLGFQKPTYEGIEEYVLATFERMYACYERDRASLDARHLCEVRYEDLVRDPVAELRAIYDRLALGDFDEAKPRIETYLADHRSYKTNRHEVSEEERRRIAERWRAYAERYGYA